MDIPRSYTRTSFWMFVACFIITVVLEYIGVSAEQVSEYVGGVVTKTFNNMSVFMIWLGPLAIAFKEYKNDQAKLNAKLQIELATIKSKQNVQVAEISGEDTTDDDKKIAITM